MSTSTVLLIMSIVAGSSSLPRPSNFLDQYNDLQLVTREEWNARPPHYVTKLNTPTPMVIIHHSYDPGACYNIEECSVAMRYMQDMHQIDNEWEDIGYNFAVGSDGVVYEGRGWETVGAHAAGYNAYSIGIVLIGDWVSNLPPANQIATVKKLIRAGIDMGYISPEYSLIGHRQVRATECPGQALFDEIATWDQFENTISL